MKYPALLLAAASLLVGVSAPAAGACAQPASVFASEGGLSVGCCGQNTDSAPANAHPCGACFDHCESENHAAHLGAGVFFKRPGKNLSTPLPAVAAFLPAATQHVPVRPDRQRLLPNSVLASLRAVVLLI